MLMYLASNSRQDIAFAAHQCACFTHCPKRTHEVAVKRIARYLKGTREKRMKNAPTNDLKLDLWVDADFAGLWNAEDAQDPASVQSRSGCCHRAAGATNGPTGRGWSDLHDARRTDILPEVQYQTAVLGAVQHTDWKTMYVAWTVCEQTMPRMGLLQVLKFCNLCCNFTHGPTCLMVAETLCWRSCWNQDFTRLVKMICCKIVQGYTVTSRIFCVATLPLQSQL
jgi:hypothetical protein